MIEERRGAPYGILLAVVVVVLVGIPMFLGDGGEVVTEFIAELLTPIASSPPVNLTLYIVPADLRSASH
ncbi:hypothetical protein E3N88_26838 [Mikania micrantha]|uniref:Uncharacterized protein n=1 Tax=Mikania micrantha TaxID=192012 RepID=A0A5N6MVZ5_9ASTR|nr:hypothetical protein E3N88_26838 [Mikania micrantha]